MGFQQIVSPHQKLDGNIKKPIQMVAFQEALHNLGQPSTWRKRLYNDSSIQERLDRAIATMERRRLFLKACVLHLPFTSLDHRPILLDLHEEV